MKLLKIALLSSLLLSTMVWAGTFEVVTSGYPFRGQSYEQIKERVMANAIRQTTYIPNITEGTNLRTDNYVWKVSYSPYNVDGDIILLNPHPTLESLNQRALQIAKERISPISFPITESDRHAFKNLLNFTDQDIQDIIDIKQEIQINFGTQNHVFNVARRRIIDAFSHSYFCFSDSQKHHIDYWIDVRGKVNESGRISSIEIRGLDDDKLNDCLSNRLRHRKYMILNQDGVPVPYNFSATINLN